MAHQLKQESNLCSQDNVDNCNLTNRGSKRKITQISEQHNVNKKAKICEENAIDLIHCNELQEKTCKFDNVDILAENIPILVDNSNVLENTCTNTHKTNKQEKLTLKSKLNFHQCKFCTRSFRSAQTLAVHCNFQHKDNLVTSEASVSSDVNDCSDKNVNNTRPSTQRSTASSNDFESAKQVISVVQNDKNHTEISDINLHCVEFNSHCNNEQVCNNDVNVNSKEIEQTANKSINAKARNKNLFEKNINKEKIPINDLKCVQKNGKLTSNQQKNKLNSECRNYHYKKFCTVMQNQYCCTTCDLMFLNKKDAGEHVSTNHSEVKETSKIITMTKRIFKCKRNGKQCTFHKSLYYKKSVLSKKCKQKSEVVIVQRFYCPLCTLHFSKHHFCVNHLKQVHDAYKRATDISSKLTTLYKCCKCHGVFKSRVKLKFHVSVCNSLNKLKHSKKLRRKSVKAISNKDTKNPDMKPQVVKEQVSYLTETLLVETKQASKPSATVISSSKGDITIPVTSELQGILQQNAALTVNSTDIRIVPKENLHSSAHQYQNNANSGIQCQQYGFQEQSTHLGVHHTICDSTSLNSNPMNFTSITSLCNNSENISENFSNDNAEQYVKSLANIVDLNMFEIIIDATYFCPICNLAHKNKVQVLEHMHVDHPQLLSSAAQISVTKTISFNCKMCQLKQDSAQDCMQHAETCHKIPLCSNLVCEVNVDRFHCTKCELHFAMRHHCIRHMYTFHGIKVRDKSFINSAMTTMYKCINCLKIYPSMTALNNHTCQNLATKNDSPYSSMEVLHHFCPLCEQHFPGIKSCQRHISLTHPNENNLEDEFIKIVSKMCVIWICHICSTLRTKHFDSKDALADHLITHSIKLNLISGEVGEIDGTMVTGKHNTRSKLSQKKTNAKSKSKQKPLKKEKKKQKKNYSENDTTDDSQDCEHIFGLDPDEDTYDSQHSKSSLNFADPNDIKVEYCTNNFVTRMLIEYPCLFCTSVFGTEYATVQHIEQDHANMLHDKIKIVPQSQQIFTCKTCDTIVYSTEECSQHDSVCAPSFEHSRVIEVKIKRIHCSSCHQHFAMRHHCIRHMSKVHAIKGKMHMELQSKLTTMYKCPKCMKLYHSTASLHSHVGRCTIAFQKQKATYSKVEDELYFCAHSPCSQYFTSMYLCRRHMNSCHNDAVVSNKNIISKVCAVWICHICSSLRKKYFDSKASLGEHMLKHKIKINDNEEISTKLEIIRNISDENTSNEAFTEQDHKKTYLKKDYSKSDKSEKYEPPVYINTLPASNFNTQANSRPMDVSQSPYIENVSMDFYSTNLANVTGNDFTQNLPLHQNSTFDQTQANIANSRQGNKETNTESLLYGFQILNSMSTTTDSELHFDKPMNQNHVPAIDPALTSIQDISSVYVPHSNMQYSQSYLNNFEYGPNAPYPSLDYSEANLPLAIKPVLTNDPNFYLYTPEYVNTSSLSYSRDDLAILHNVRPEIPEMVAANDQHLYPVDTYSNVPQHSNIAQYSNFPQYTETNILTQEQNYQEFNINNAQGMDQSIQDSLLQEKECSIQVSRSHCPLCNLHFSKQHDCVYHIRNTHPTDLLALINIVTMPTTMYKCQNCDKLCVTILALQSHMLKCKTTKNKHSYSCTNENRYFCPYCQQHFQNMFLCERHINLIHKDMSAFNHNIENKSHNLWICHLCSTLRTKYFDTKSLLADHMLVKHYITIDDMQQDENSSSFRLSETTDMLSFCSTENSIQNSLGESSFVQMQESNHCEDFQNVSSQQCQITQEFIINDDAMQQTLPPQFPSSESVLFQVASNEPVYHPKIQQDPLCQTSTIPDYNTETFSVHSDNTQFSYANSESHDTESNTEFSIKQEDTSTQMSLRNEQNSSEDHDSSAAHIGEFASGEQNSESLWTVEVLRTHCNICMLHFSNPQNCMNHIKVAHKCAVSIGEHIHTKMTTMYKCDKCTKICIAKAAVKHHISICKSVKNHKEDAYSKIKGIRYFCPECQQHFSSVAMCRRHININHENAQNLFVDITKKTCDLWLCQICSTLKSKFFDSKLLLAEHMTRHNVVVNTDDTADVETVQSVSLNTTLQTPDPNVYPSSSNTEIQEVTQNLPQNELQQFQNTKNAENFQSTSVEFVNTNYQPTNVNNLQNTPVEFVNTNYQPTNVVNNSQSFFSEAFNAINYQDQEPMYTTYATEVNDNIDDANNVHSEYQVANSSSENSNEYLSAEHLENNNPVLSEFTSCMQSGFSCLLCDKYYKTKLSVLEHVKINHQIDSFESSTHISKRNIENYVCKVCNVSVYSIAQCIEHKSICQAHEEDSDNEFAVHVRRFYCPVCYAHHSQRQHTYSHLMKMHNNDHTASKNILHLETLMYKCNNCSKLLGSITLLKIHKYTCNKSQTNKSEGKFSKVVKNLYYCPTCEQHFSCQTYCKKHMKQCHKDSDNLNPIRKLRHVWICNLCSSLRTRQFDTKSSLAKHMLSHDFVVEASESDSDDECPQRDTSEATETQDLNKDQELEVNNELKYEIKSHSNDNLDCNVKEIEGDKVPEATRRMTRSSTNTSCS